MWRSNTSSNFDTAIPAVVATNNVRLAGTTFNISVSSPTTINSLMIAQNGSVAGSKLTITSGALAMGTSVSNGLATISNDLQFGASDAAEAILTVTASNTLSFSGMITTSGGLTKGGVARSILNNSANSYGGPTTINGGEIQLGASGVIPDASAVVLSGGTLDVNGQTETVGSIAGAGSILLGSGALTSGGDNTSTSFSGAITGSGGSLIKAGSGKLTLSGVSGFTGSTTISGGTLALGASATVASPSIIVGTSSGSTAKFDVSAVTNGFTLANTQTLSGFGTVVGPITVKGTISPGASPGNLSTDSETWNADSTNGGAGSYVVDIADLNGTSGVGWDHLTLSNLSSLTLTTTGTGQFTVKVSNVVAANFNQNQPFAIRIVDGAIDSSVMNNLSRLTVNGSAFVTANHVTNGGFFSLDVESDHIDLNYVPEPSTLGLLALAGFSAIGRRRRENSSPRN